MKFSLKEAERLDRQDPLKGLRKEFLFPMFKKGQPYIYLCGNSLGLQPKGTRRYIDQELKDWAALGVEGHFHATRPWLPYHEFVTASLAKLVGGSKREVVAMNSATVNAHILLSAFYRPTADRHKILIERSAFPSDEYAVASQVELHGFDKKQSVLHAEPTNESVLEMIARHGSEIAVVWLGNVHYLSGYAFDLKAIAQAAHANGALFGVDLAHAIGNLHLSLHDDGVDFATWCSYKYLNSGPGGISGIFVHEKHGLDTRRPRLSGWWGHNKTTRFAMGPDFDPIPGAEGYQLSNPPIFQLAALRASLDLFDRAGIAKLRKKSVQLTGFLEAGLRQEIPALEIWTPSDPARRGCQLSLRLPRKPKNLVQNLLKKGVICDFREPNIVRVAPTPLYSSYKDVFRFVEILQSILEKK